MPLNHTQFIICCIHSFHTWMSDVYQVWGSGPGLLTGVSDIAPNLRGSKLLLLVKAFAAPLSFPPHPPSPFQGFPFPLSLFTSKNNNKGSISPQCVHGIGRDY